MRHRGKGSVSPYFADGAAEAQGVEVTAQGHMAEAALEPRTVACQSLFSGTQHGPDYCGISLPHLESQIKAIFFNIQSWGGREKGKSELGGGGD